MWWEKTVEYLFVITYINRKVMMAPLDGNYEAGGDLVARHDDGWVLIEFKRNEDAIDDEVQKFADPSEDSFDKAKSSLSGSDGHHLLIFGEKGSSEPLELKVLTYFQHQLVEPNDALSCGIGQDEFNNYLSEFLRFKLGETEEGSGGRSLDYSTVLAVNGDGGVSHCEGLASYCDRMNIGPGFNPDPTPTSTRSFGMSGPR